MIEKTTWIGLLLGVGGILFGNYMEGGHFTSLLQGAAFFIVFGGTLGAVVLSNPSDLLKRGFFLTKKAIYKTDPRTYQIILNELLECTRLARKETLLSIEPKVAQMKHPFMQSVLKCVVDGVDPQTIRAIFERQIQIEEDDDVLASKIWMDAGGFSPTIGIIGAVLGLIHVMSNLSDTSKLGSGIATAFVATIYGVGAANLIFIPVANKIKKKVQKESYEKEMILEGALGIQAGLSPGIIQVKLFPFLEKLRNAK